MATLLRRSLLQIGEEDKKACPALAKLLNYSLYFMLVYREIVSIKQETTVFTAVKFLNIFALMLRIFSKEMHSPFETVIHQHATGKEL